MHAPDYCREIEAYLCQKNDGHLIRVVGPAFDLVSGWAAAGLPLKIAFRGIDRCFERYYRKGPRRRPVRIEFCEADVLDAFDQWRQAIGLTAQTQAGEPAESAAHPARSVSSRGPSLARHLEHVLLRLTEARVRGALAPSTDELLDRVNSELDVARASARGLRGEARHALVHRLADLDAELIEAVREGMEDSLRRVVEREADEELSAFRDRLAPEAYNAAREAAIARLVRERFGLPTLKLA